DGGQIQDHAAGDRHRVLCAALEVEAGLAELAPGHLAVGGQLGEGVAGRRGDGDGPRPGGGGPAGGGEHPGRGPGQPGELRGASCEVSVELSASGTASSSPSRRPRPSEWAPYLRMAWPLGRSVLNSTSPVTWTVGNHPEARYCSTHWARASACLRFMRSSKAE